MTQILAAFRDENVPAFRLGVVKVTAKLLLVRVLKSVLKVATPAMTQSIRTRNDRLANHVRWFRSAAIELRARVDATGNPASPRLMKALDDLRDAVDKDSRRLLPLLELLDARSRLGFEVHKSVRILSDLKAAAAEMKSAGTTPEVIDAFDSRLENSRRRFAQLHSEILRGHIRPRGEGGVQSHVPSLKAYAENA